MAYNYDKFYTGLRSLADYFDKDFYEDEKEKMLFEERENQKLKKLFTETKYFQQEKQNSRQNNIENKTKPKESDSQMSDRQPRQQGQTEKLLNKISEYTERLGYASFKIEIGCNDYLSETLKDTNNKCYTALVYEEFTDSTFKNLSEKKYIYPILTDAIRTDYKAFSFARIDYELISIVTQLEAKLSIDSLRFFKSHLNDNITPILNELELRIKECNKPEEFKEVDETFNELVREIKYCSDFTEELKKFIEAQKTIKTIQSHQNAQDNDKKNNS